MPADLLDAIGRLDVSVFRWLRIHHHRYLDVVMWAVSETSRGYGLWIIIPAALGLLRRRPWPAVFQTLLVIGITALLVDGAAKPFFARTRPFEDHLETRVYGPRPTTPSFPSGHAAGAVAGAYALGRIAPNARTIVWALAFLVCTSRIYLGVHYPLDVLVGALLGLFAAVVVIGGTKWTYAESRK
jgi:membrane-associated phospholipid phosphatase